ncbi:LysR substrate-binding domain-containing protein [Craterilacuibacter sp. RT1T]|uniref:LysR substrate-binding domain-containing protein n=1 Tax=Craterilacuibacter sp. RT1T TaxID=2942211 RepID=UPI0020C09603|nr:LysR substrate-binding domain-containing protein [Craterilacuibacter sp. RT1T]MCL6264090.1 LysR substrate-binding domain-containing protein [Craterilacuibacter sp. RT1T]
METRWLEDFLVLAETGSFTRSAEIRHLTQPAFSRRIKSLEGWAGTELIDRTCYPTQLTAAGLAFRQEAAAVLAQMRAARSRLAGMRAMPADTLEFSVPHTLSFSFFPHWLSGVVEDFGALSCRLQASNVHDALLAFVEGGSDLLMCYHHARQPVSLSDAYYSGLKLGLEHLRPYARADGDGQPCLRLPGTEAQPLPFLGYSPGAYFYRMSELLLGQAPESAHLSLRYETDMAEGLKHMVLQGHGVAFLPDSAVQEEIKRGELALAGGEGWQIDMEVRLYRDIRRQRPALDALWRYLSGRYPRV